MITEQTAQRIAVALERVIELLEKMANPLMVVSPTFNPNACPMCGNQWGHGGLPCPKLTPTN